MAMTETRTEPTKPAAEAPIRMTEAALQQVRWLLARQDNPALFLRIGVKGGGCTGYSYVLDLQSEKTDWDSEYDFDGVPVVIDRKSRKLLAGTTIDFDTPEFQKAVDLYTGLVTATDFSDGVHLNEAGSQKVSDRFFAVLEPLFAP